MAKRSFLIQVVGIVFLASILSGCVPGMTQGIRLLAQASQLVGATSSLKKQVNQTGWVSTSSESREDRKPQVNILASSDADTELLGMKNIYLTADIPGYQNQRILRQQLTKKFMDLGYRLVSRSRCDIEVYANFKTTRSNSIGSIGVTVRKKGRVLKTISINYGDDGEDILTATTDAALSLGRKSAG